jgi:hypothetical protein
LTSLVGDEEKERHRGHDSRRTSEPRWQPSMTESRQKDERNPQSHWNEDHVREENATKRDR